MFSSSAERKNPSFEYILLVWSKSDLRVAYACPSSESGSWTIRIVSLYGPCANVDRICVDYACISICDQKNSNLPLTKLSKIGRLKIRMYRYGSEIKSLPAGTPLSLSVGAGVIMATFEAGGGCGR